jgi:hypothetical protein
LFWRGCGIPLGVKQFKFNKVMAVKLAKYEGGSANLTSQGTIVETIGTDGSISFIRKNFNNPEKRVALLLKNKKGESAIISCSRQLSDEIRKKNITVADIFGLEIVENEDEVMFVTMPSEGAIQTFNYKEFKGKGKPRVVSADFIPDELIFGS